jgi:hypothetical protein
MSNHARLHNPNYVGPGLWYGIHTMAANAKTPERKRYAIEEIRNLQSNFPCGECKIHFGNYLSTHSPETTINGNEEALFLWSFNFHNAVNHRLKKPQVSYDDAKKIFYTDSEFCMSDCGSENKVNEKDKVNKKPRLIPRDTPGDIF